MVRQVFLTPVSEATETPESQASPLRSGPFHAKITPL